MAEDNKKELPEVKLPKTQEYKIKKEVTVDRLYRIGEKISLPSGKLKDKLTSNNII
jgi:hypothetical protein